jgi:A/G-specific adenine glycosylase
MMPTPSTIPVKARLAASRSAPAQSGVNSAGAAKDLGRFRRALLRWYDQHRRELPWRETHEPYRIWLSEIMLQQTRVAAVLDHYRIFLERFPTVHALAAAPDDLVLAAWSGLGYYRRARMLHQCAKELVLNHNGRFPQNADDLQTLPGIGRYTAAAIASIAFAEPVAVVDGNVERVLQRFMGIDLTVAQTWQHAQAFLASSRPGDFNQAMMELGATVCVPREPRCLMCPVQEWCITQQSNQAASRTITHAITRAITMERRLSPPGKTPPPTIRQVKKTIWCVLNHRNDGIYLAQRSKKASLMPGMWELPQSSQPPLATPTSAHWRTFRHSITVTDYTVHVLRNSPLANASFSNASPSARGKWIAIDRISQIPITGLTRKILKAGGII